MESTDSVSRGVFLFCKKTSKPKNSFETFEKTFNEQLWYITYKRNWHFIQNELKDLHHQMYDKLLTKIVGYISSCEEEVIEGVVPSAALLTGVNQPDHTCQFTALIDRIRQDVTPHVAMVTSQDSSTLKFLVENAVWQLIDGHEDVLKDLHCDEVTTKKIKKYQCTMKVLQKWYNAIYNVSSPKKKKQKKIPLVIIIPDFESFNSNVLQDFIMITSSYISTLPIVLVFGVATTVSALHKSLPYNVSSKMLIRVFHSIPSNLLINHVIDSVILTPACPMSLAGNVLEFLTDVYIFYDFSVAGLVEGIKFCMIEHYYGDTMKSLCCERDRIEEALNNLSTDDVESVRHLYSFRSYVESQPSCNTQIQLLENDFVLKEALFKELNNLHDYFYSYYACLRLLFAFVKNLPQSPLGKTLRELYIKCNTNLVTESTEFKECMLLLGFQSQDKLMDTIKEALTYLNQSMKNSSPMRPLQASPLKNNTDNATVKKELGEKFVEFVKIQLLLFQKQIENAKTETTTLCKSRPDNGDDDEIENVPENRYRLKEKLLQSTRRERIQSEFEMVRSRLVSYLEEMFSVALQPPRTRPFHELMLFSDLAAVKKHIVGSPRGALHTALITPQMYLRCNCCSLPSPDSMKDTLPDVSLVYKLHRECGKHINLYDWLQAFAAVLRPDDDAEQRHLDPLVQARFSQAVSALHFLGFIKSSKRKTDHVMRLTW